MYILIHVCYITNKRNTYSLRAYKKKRNLHANRKEKYIFFYDMQTKDFYTILFHVSTLVFELEQVYFCLISIFVTCTREKKAKHTHSGNVTEGRVKIYHCPKTDACCGHFPDAFVKTQTQIFSSMLNGSLHFRLIKKVNRGTCPLFCVLPHVSTLVCMLFFN